MNLKFNYWNGALPLFLLFFFPPEKSFSQEDVKFVRTSELKGNVVDLNLNKSLEYATVSIYSLPDSLLQKGTITNRKGNFLLQNLKQGKYYYKVEHIGYQTYNSKDINLQENEKHNLNKSIALEVDAELISEVEIKANRDYSRIELDRTVYNVSKSPVSDGGSINDVLATIPKLDINADGELKFRGSSDVKVLIDGKMSGLLGMSSADVLRNLPAADVDRVEVMSSPSAKYDASGSAGIVNIIMKKERAKGLNGNVSANFGTVNKHGSRAALSLRTGKLNFSGSYNYLNEWAGRDYEIDRSISILDGTRTVKSIADVDYGNKSHRSKLGLDYLINDKNTLSFSLTNRDIKQNFNGAYNNYSKRSISNDSPLEDITQVTVSEGVSRISEVDRDLNSWVYNASYIRKFAKKGRELSIDAAFTDNTGKNEGKYEDYTGISKDFHKINRAEAIVQVDYKQPLGESSTLETGYLFRTNKINYKAPIDISTVFDYQESVQALYLQLGGTKGNLGYQLGLRSEYTDVETNQELNDDYFDLFPSLHLSYKLSDNKQIQLSYSKAVYRPNSRMLNPFQNLQNPENQRFGDQKLNAYYTNKSEVTYIYKSKKVTYTTNLYYQYRKDIIGQFRLVNEDDIAVVNYKNLGDKYTVGLDFNLSTKLNKWWSLNSYLTGIYQKYTSNKKLNFKTNEDHGFFGKLTSIMRIPKLFTFQSAFIYETELPFAQGDYVRTFHTDFAFAKRILKNKASITLWIYDVFKTKSFDANSSGDRFIQNFKYKREFRYANLTFRYYFGKKYQVLKAKKRRSNSSHSERDI